MAVDVRQARFSRPSVTKTKKLLIVSMGLVVGDSKKKTPHDLRWFGYNNYQFEMKKGYLLLRNHFIFFLSAISDYLIQSVKGLGVHVG